MLLIGNDLVSLAPAHKVGFKDKFIQRVCSPGEKTLLTEVENEDLLLWRLWSAKESAYKFWVKADPSTIFKPRDFVVVEIEKNQGKILYKDNTIDVFWSQQDEYLHCYVLDKLQGFRVDFQVVHKNSLKAGGFSSQEELSIYSEESRAVRLLARRLLQQHCSSCSNWEIIRRRGFRSQERFGPPMVYKDGVPWQGGDISMSHHGEWVGASLLWQV